MKNVGNIKDCYGCGVCAVGCPTNIIKISLNRNGFYEPEIADESKCISCGICTEICAFNHEERFIKNIPLISWGGWSDDKDVRFNCSSGGIAFDLLRQLQKKGYKVIACRYEASKEHAEHYCPENELELIESMGSKYIQSYTVGAFMKMRSGQNYVVVGTPCQIDSLRRMIKKFKIKSNIILIDFFCHGVPSYLAWRAYLKMAEKRIGKIKRVAWRSKLDKGWQDSYVMCLDNEGMLLNNESIDIDVRLKGKRYPWMHRKSQGDIFYKLFLGDLCMNPACSKNCKYKYNKSSADIRIGDLWGSTYKDNFNGVSAVVAFTDQGCDVVNELTGVSLKEYDFEKVAEGQMKTNAKPKLTSPIVMWCLRKGISLDSLSMKTVFFTQKVINKIKAILG